MSEHRVNEADVNCYGWNSMNGDASDHYVIAAQLQQLALLLLDIRDAIEASNGERGA